MKKTTTSRSGGIMKLMGWTRISNFWSILFVALTTQVSISGSQANTNFYIEPGVGLATGNFEQNSSSVVGNATEETTAYGINFTIRTGLRYQIFFGGLDFNGGPLSYQPTGRKGTSSWMFLGPAFGFQAPDFPFRLWVAYSFMSRYQIKNDPGITRLYKGGAFKIAASFQFRPFTKTAPKISLSLGYVIHNFTSARGVDGTHDEKSFPIKVGAPTISHAKPALSLWLITLSLPLEFGHVE